MSTALELEPLAQEENLVTLKRNAQQLQRLHNLNLLKDLARYTSSTVALTEGQLIFGGVISQQILLGKS